MPPLHCRAQLAGLVSERDGLREDLHSQREAKRMSDQGWKSERQKVQNLEKELAFYQSQSTRCVWHPLHLHLECLPCAMPPSRAARRCQDSHDASCSPPDCEMHLKIAYAFHHSAVQRQG